MKEQNPFDEEETRRELQEILADQSRFIDTNIEHIKMYPYSLAESVSYIPPRRPPNCNIGDVYQKLTLEIEAKRIEDKINSMYNGISTALNEISKAAEYIGLTTISKFALKAEDYLTMRRSYKAFNLSEKYCIRKKESAQRVSECVEFVEMIGQTINSLIEDKKRIANQSDPEQELAILYVTTHIADNEKLREIALKTWKHHYTDAQMYTRFEERLRAYAQSITQGPAKLQMLFDSDQIV